MEYKIIILPPQKDLDFSDEFIENYGESNTFRIEPDSLGLDWNGYWDNEVRIYEDGEL